MKQVTDAALLQQLNGAATGKPVTDPAILSQLNAGRAVPEPAVNELVDSIRTLPGGLAQFAAAMAGLPGDVNSLLDSGANWLMSKATGKPVNISTNSFPTSAGINKAVSEPFGGYYKPKTTAGEYTQTVASFAPAALAPGSAAARLGRVVVPGVLSEDAGQLTKGTPYEPFARAGGALLGGLGMGALEGAVAAKASPTPTMAQLKEMKDAAYKAADQAGVVIAPESFQKFATDLGVDLTKKNIAQAEVHKNALAALDIVKKEAATGAPLSLERADVIRQAVNGAIEAAAKNNGGDLRLASKVKSALDDYLDNITVSDTLAGDASVAVPILKEARALAQREFKAKEIQKLIDLAENQAGANYSASGVGQSLRAQFKNLNAQLIKNPNLAKSFSREERAAITKVVQGGPVENALRLVGKLAPTNNISMGVGTSLGAAAGSFLGGPVGAGVGAVAVPALGAGARLGATALTSKNAQATAEIMRRGAALPQTQNSAALLADTILGLQGAHR